MPRRTVPVVSGSYYHIYNRGHNGADNFFDVDNYVFFLSQLRKYLVCDHARVIAYVLMPNHSHFLLEAVSDRFSCMQD